MDLFKILGMILVTLVNIWGVEQTHGPKTGPAKERIVKTKTEDLAKRWGMLDAAAAPGGGNLGDILSRLIAAVVELLNYFGVFR